MLNPNFLDQKSALERQFSGMIPEQFSYEEYEKVRHDLIDLIGNSLTIEEKDFLLNFKNLTPVWEKYNYADFPSVRWEIQNLEKLREKNPDKHLQLYTTLKELLGR